MKTKIVLSTLAMLIAVTALPQSNLAVDYYRLKEYEKSKKLFDIELNTNPVESYFYLGEIAFAEGNISKAEECYTKGLKINGKDAYNQIGLSKIKLKSDKKSAENALASTAKKHKKNVDIAIAIGYAYLDNEMFDEAQNKVADAKKINAKAPGIYILEGDICAMDKNGKQKGEATSKYEMANYFDPDFALGYMKIAQLYENINAILAIEKLKTIIEKQPTYSVAYSYLGKVYTINGFYPQAIQAYKTYFNFSVYSIQDIERYARALYFNENYLDAQKLVQEGLLMEPDHFVLNRYRLYIDAKTKNTADGLDSANKFFSLRNDSGYIAQDYAMFAVVLRNYKRYDEAIIAHEKSIKLEPEKNEFYAEAAVSAREGNNYALAAAFMKKMMVNKASLSGQSNYTDDIVDINSLGYDYYSAGINIKKNKLLAEKLIKDDELLKNMLANNKRLNQDSLANSIDYFTKNYSLIFLNKADSVFDILIARIPDSYSGYRYKALIKHAINPDTEVGIAKPYYEKVIEIIKDKNAISNSNKKILLEAYSYLGYHYYMKEDKPNTILYWSKVLELDPQNENAKLVLEDINKKDQK